MKTLARLEKSGNYWFLLFTSFVFFLLRLPSLFEPYWYGDEGIYQVLGMGIKSGKLLYRDIFDNKPPLLYVLYSFFNGGQFGVRVLNLLFGVISILIFFFLTKKMFKSDKASYVSTSIFALSLAIPAFEGNIANAENFMIPITLFVGLILYLIISNANKKAIRKNTLLFLAGIGLGISFLFKIVAIFDFAAFFLFLAFSDPTFKLHTAKKISSIISLFRKLSSFVLGFILPIAITALIFLLSGAFQDFTRATFFSNVGYVGYGNKFIIPQGLLIFKLLLLGAFTLFILWKKEKLTLPGIFVYLWLGFSIFNAFFSQRPYTHYLLTLVPAFCLLLAFAIANKKWQRFSFVLVIITVFLCLKSFNIYHKNVAYYKNFLSFMNGEKTASRYQAFFDRRTPIDYQLAEYISQNTKDSDNIFVWGNNAQLYKMTDKLPPGRYAVAYHTTSYKDGYDNTLAGLMKTKPKLIIMMPYMNNFPFSLTGYTAKIMVSDVSIYERDF